MWSNPQELNAEVFGTRELVDDGVLWPSWILSIYVSESMFASKITPPWMEWASSPYRRGSSWVSKPSARPSKMPWRIDSRGPEFNVYTGQLGHRQWIFMISVQYHQEAALRCFHCAFETLERFMVHRCKESPILRYSNRITIYISPDWAALPKPLLNLSKHPINRWG